jgi:DNA-binding LacI/PurR family transcriptional regulator
MRIVDERLEGYRDGLRAAHIEPDPQLLAFGSFNEEGGYEAGRSLFARPPYPTAVFAANDLSAVGVLNAVAESGRRVPDDVSVIGFDDVRLAAYTSPPLTTIHQPAREIGAHATSLLFDLARGKKPRRLHHLFRPELVVRRSTAPPRRRVRTR